VIRKTLLLLPIAGLLAYGADAFDNHAIKYPALMIAIAAALVAALAKRRLAWTNLSVALWLLVAVEGVMVLRSPLPGRALRWWGLLLGLTLWHHAASGLCSRRQFFRHASPLLAALLAILSGISLIQLGLDERQAHALFANRNFAGAGLAMLLPFAFQSRHRGWLVPLAIAGLFATKSRGGALAAASATALWLAWARPRARIPLLVGIPAVVLAGGLLLKGEANTVKVRLAWYRTAAAIGLEHPLLGTGADGFAREYPPLRPIEEHRISGGKKVHAVHNDYLQSFADGGLLGLLAHLFALVVLARAARKNRPAACLLLAFAIASLVDLPFRDPSLLALAFFTFPMFARRTRAPFYAAIPGLALVLALLPEFLGHWAADREFARYLATGQGTYHLDRALAHERRHPEALIERSDPKDLELLIAQQPHHAGAHYNLTRDLFEEEAIAALRAILKKHDPHHTLTRVRLAVLLKKRDPVAAASILDDAIDADPRPFLTWAVLASIHREAGRLKLARRFLKEAEHRSGSLIVRRERLLLELAAKGDIAGAARRMPPGELRRMIRDRLARAEADLPRNLEREPGETAAQFAERIQKAKEQHRAGLYPIYKEAAELAVALVTIEPTAGNFRLFARAAQGIGEIDTVRRSKGWAEFLDTLSALADKDLHGAGQHLKRALAAYPELLDDEAVLPAITQYIRDNPQARETAEVLFKPYPPFFEAVQEA